LLHPPRLEETRILTTIRWYQDGRLLAVLSAAAFSLKAIFVKMAYAAYPTDAVTLLAVRMAIALPAFLWLGRGAITALGASRRLWGGLTLLGISGYYLSSLFDFMGLRSISAGLERLILFTYPMLVILLEAMWRRRPIQRRVIVGMGTAYLGIAVAFWHDLHALGDSASVLVGGAWVFLGSLTYAGYYMGTSFLMADVGSARLTGVSGTIACVLILGQFLVTHGISDLARLPPAFWGWAAAMAVVSTALPIWLLAAAVERMGAVRTAAVGSLGPAITIVFGWILLGDAFSVAQLAGVTLVIGGVWWIGRA
jgi:drug/metabolite transporter (DMT)-like permease